MDEKFISSALRANVVTSAGDMGVHEIIVSPQKQYAPLAVIYPSTRCVISPMLFISAYGLPVEMTLFMPRALAAVSAAVADAGILWVLKLTSVPSISKNRAFIMMMSLVSKGKVTQAETNRHVVVRF